MYAHVPPLRCASATTCIASVDFPEDSGPKISTIRPRGSPPMPSARSSARAPVGIASIPTLPRSPRRMMAPFPNCFSIWPSAMSSDLSRSIRADSFWVPPSGGSWLRLRRRTGVRGRALAPPSPVTGGTVRRGCDTRSGGLPETTSVEFHRCGAPYDEHSFDASTIAGARLRPAGMSGFRGAGTRGPAEKISSALRREPEPQACPRRTCSAVRSASPSSPSRCVALVLVLVACGSSSGSKSSGSTSDTTAKSTTPSTAARGRVRRHGEPQAHRVQARRSSRSPPAPPSRGTRWTPASTPSPRAPSSRTAAA